MLELLWEDEMLIKKDEIFTLMHGICEERNKPMVALQDFDLVEVSNQITADMDEHNTAVEAWMLIEHFEDMGLAKPLIQTLIHIYSEDGQISAELGEEYPRVTPRRQ